MQLQQKEIASTDPGLQRRFVIVTDPHAVAAQVLNFLNAFTDANMRAHFS